MQRTLRRLTVGLTAATLAAVGVVVPAAAAQAAPPTELFVSEYIEGSSNNKAIEIATLTGAARVAAGNAGSDTLQRRDSGTPNRPECKCFRAARAERGWIRLRTWRASNVRLSHLGIAHWRLARLRLTHAMASRAWRRHRRARESHVHGLGNGE